jgi:hypothetical protein
MSQDFTLISLFLVHVFFYDRCHGHKDAAAIRAKKFVYENYFFQQYQNGFGTHSN